MPASCSHFFFYYIKMVPKCKCLKTLLSAKSHANPCPHSPCAVRIAPTRNHLCWLFCSPSEVSLCKNKERNMYFCMPLFLMTPLCTLRLAVNNSGAYPCLEGFLAHFSRPQSPVWLWRQPPTLFSGRVRFPGFTDHNY